MKYVIFLKKSGMALISVLFMVVILVTMTSALLILNSNHVFFVSTYYHRMNAVNIAESAVQESVLKLKNDLHWGESNPSDTYLYWISSDQDKRLGDVCFPETGQNSKLEHLSTKGAFYITFNPSSPFPYDSGESPRTLAVG